MMLTGQTEDIALAEAAAGRLGIALSGGGSRAVAFHLGCLRALKDLGLLNRAKVMSTASGGSVIGAMFALHDGPFVEFEDHVRGLLRTGLVAPAVRTAVTTSEGLKAALCLVTLGASWAALAPFKMLAGITWRDRPATVHESWMPHRFASRTTILRKTFDARLFKGAMLKSLRQDRPELVIIATELRTGSAFYFGRNDAGCWRFGHVDPADIPIAHAVAASAAYPLLLPALDERYLFRRRDSSLVGERVTLTDGGVYDNLALAPLWPDRDSGVSIDVPPVDTIIACRAGYGLRTAKASLFIKARMTAAFETVHGRAQNATMKRLFDLKAAGRLKAFVLPYLDQDDRRLAFPPADLVTRASVADYPTNFAAMPDEWIERLSRRGEQLTLALIHEHAPHLGEPTPAANQHSVDRAAPTVSMKGA